MLELPESNNDHADQQKIFLGRQPILDRWQNIVGYELLFRSANAGGANVIDDLEASASVITHAYGELGIQGVLGNARGYFNVSANLLVSDMIELLPRDQVVLELLESIQITELVILRCEALKKKGFKFAMDDFVEFDDMHRPLLQMVDIVKVDVSAVDRERLPDLVKQLKSWPAQLLAEKVETWEQMKECMALGFDFFQGYYFAKPTIIAGKRPEPSKLALLKLLGLALSEAENEELEREFKPNPNLTYSLLRLVNSVASGVPKKISSLSQAILILGRRQIQRWVQLLLFATKDSQGGQCNPLMQLAATRGVFMELLARKERPATRAYHDQAFMTGIMSLLDALLDMPMQDILAELNLEEEVKWALLERRGELGHLLKLAQCLEQGGCKATQQLLEESPALSMDDLIHAELEAMRWASDLSKNME